MLKYSCLFPSANNTVVEVDLMGVVRDVLFTAVVPTLFGDGVLPHTQQDIKHFQKQFVQYDGSFEHGAKLPEFLLKEWAKSKHFLLNRFCEVLRQKSTMDVKGDTLLQSMADSLEGDCVPNYAVMLLWASLANAVPITFWTLAFVLSDQSIKKDVQKEADEVLGPYLKDRGEIGVIYVVPLPLFLSLLSLSLLPNARPLSPRRSIATELNIHS